jgi:hypothetical protein
MSESTRINAMADRLSEEFVTETGDAAEPDHVGAVVASAAERLSDAPVQDFVPLLVENAARDQLHQEGLHVEPTEEDSAPARRDGDAGSGGLLSGFAPSDVASR